MGVGDRRSAARATTRPPDHTCEAMSDYRQISVTARSAAPPAVVFDVIADGARWAEWVPFIPRSIVERPGDPAPDGVGSIRQFGLGPLGSREEITSSVRPHHLTYVALSGIPVRSYRATVDLTPDGDGTAISWRGELDAYPFTAPVLAAVLQRVLQVLATNAAKEAERRHGAQ